MADPVPFELQGQPMRRFFLTIFLLGAFVALGAGAGALWWVNQPLKLPAPSVDL
ncbi:MAG: aminodeoxychorismate lyase [Variovorax sp.]|nr:aminodeoxychorismate lyase [Variovorax sp.]